MLTRLNRPGGSPSGKAAIATLPGGVKLEMVWIEPGTFTMGSVEVEPPITAGPLHLEFSDEQPAHEVTISRGVLLGKYLVTQRQWEAVMGNNPSYFKGPDLPVEQVSWIDARKFIGKLNHAEGRWAYRLPTEAEWEYACRAGTTTRWSFGDDESLLGEYAWYKGNSQSRTQEVGQKQPNAWGLHDMHGNVFEWCQDWYGPYAGEAQVDPQGPGEGELRVNRGGGWWRDSAAGFRSARRAWGSPVNSYGGLGFRLVKEVPTRL